MHNEFMTPSSTDNIITPKQAWDALVEGNHRFMTFREKRPNQDVERRMQMRYGQNPIVAVLACSDSRAPVELIFDQGLGDAFVIRTAGETIDFAVLGSLEYAVESLNVPLIVVMGHESCGAVAATQAALDGHEIPAGFQRVLIEKVSPSILQARAAGCTTTAEFEAHHVVETVDQVLSRAPEVKSKVSRGTCGIVGVRYRLSDGLTEPVVTIGVGE